jgi:hypothetical protein
LKTDVTLSKALRPIRALRSRNHPGMHGHRSDPALVTLSDAAERYA